MFKNRLVQVLAALILIIWGNAVFRLMSGSSNKTTSTEYINKNTEALPDLSIFNRKPILFDSTLRDPFKSYLYSKRPVVKKSKAKTTVSKKPRPQKVVSPPAIKIKSILWGGSPVAILEKNGKTELAKTGAEVWGMKVKKIMKSSVVVIKEGKEFTIRQ